MLAKVKVLYDYEAQDLDELTIKEGDLIDLVKEGRVPPLQNLFTLLICSSSDESGWWMGKVGGKEGLFPGDYVEKA